MNTGGFAAARLGVLFLAVAARKKRNQAAGAAADDGDQPDDRDDQLELALRGGRRCFDAVSAAFHLIVVCHRPPAEV